MEGIWGRALNAIDRAEVMVRAERTFIFDGEVVREMGTSVVLKSSGHHMHERTGFDHFAEIDRVV